MNYFYPFLGPRCTFNLRVLPLVFFFVRQSPVRHRHCTVSSVRWGTIQQLLRISSESPPVGWSLSTRTIRSYLGGGPDSSRRPGNPQHARWAEHKRKNLEGWMCNSGTKPLTCGWDHKDLGLSTTSYFFKALFEYWKDILFCFLAFLTGFELSFLHSRYSYFDRLCFPRVPWTSLVS